MNSFFRRLVLGAALLALCGAANAAIGPTSGRPFYGVPLAAGAGAVRTIDGDGVRVDVRVMAHDVGDSGFIPVLLEIHNSQARELDWTVNFSATGHESEYQRMQYSERVVVPANRTSLRWIYVPAPGGTMMEWGPYGGFVCTISGRGIEPEPAYMKAGDSNGMTPWAVSATLDRAIRDRINVAKLGMHTERANRLEPALTDFNQTAQPSDWRGWAPFSRVFLSADEYAGLAPAERVALDNWVALGGSLYLIPEQEVPGSMRRHGAGTVVHLAEPIGEDTADDTAHLFSWNGLHESSLVSPSGALGLGESQLVETLPANRRVGDWLGVFFICFAALIAPINLFGFAPARKRHRLFITVPTISLAAVAVLVCWIAARDGLGGRGSRIALVVLLPGENQAAVFQEQISVTGLLAGSSFALPDDTLCTELPVGGNNNNGAFDQRKLVRAGGRAEGEWFRSRARQGQHLRRLVPTRARVEFVGLDAGGTPIVQSSMGAALHKFRYVDSAGITWVANDVLPGVRVTLRRATDEITIERQASAFAAAGSPLFLHLARAAVTEATTWDGGTPGHFVALADASDLAPIPTLSSIRWTSSRVLYTGAVEHAVTSGKEAP